MPVPVTVNELGYAMMMGTGILLSGSAYAFLLAIGKLYKKIYYLILAYASYLILSIIALLFSMMLHLEGVWLIAPVILLAGYLFAPHVILHLCISTYGSRSDNNNNTNL